MCIINVSEPENYNDTAPLTYRASVPLFLKDD